MDCIINVQNLTTFIYVVAIIITITPLYFNYNNYTIALQLTQNFGSKLLGRKNIGRLAALNLADWLLTTKSVKVVSYTVGS